MFVDVVLDAKRFYFRERLKLSFYVPLFVVCFVFICLFVCLGFVCLFVLLFFFQWFDFIQESLIISVLHDNLLLF